MITFLPKRLAGQLILLLLTTLVLSQFITLIFSLSETDNMIMRVEDNRTLRKSALVANVLEKIPAENHQAIVNLLTTYRIQYHLDSKPRIPSHLLNDAQDSKVKFLKETLNRSYEKIYVHQYPAPEHRIIFIIKNIFQHLFSYGNGKIKAVTRPLLLSTSIMLEQDHWLNMTVYGRVSFPNWAFLTLTSLVVMSFVATLIVVFSIKGITKPLKELTSKAQLLGVGEDVKPIIERGPEDIKDTIAAFNAMQLRLQNIITHRTRSLAAMSHDLRTPLTSMRLHAEFINDNETQDRIVEKIDEMEHITNATISFAQQDSWSEKRRQVDLSALIDSLCQDLSDIGLTVECELNDRMSYSCRPSALRRAFSNLIENGVKYGHAVFVKIVEEDKTLKIIISDQGPGIDELQQKRLFEPFERLDESRNHLSGGLGLGMTIALTIIRSHGGDITLQNRPSKGLDVVVMLPKQ